MCKLKAHKQGYVYEPWCKLNLGHQTNWYYMKKLQNGRKVYTENAEDETRLIQFPGSDQQCIGYLTTINYSSRIQANLLSIYDDYSAIIRDSKHLNY